MQRKQDALIPVSETLADLKVVLQLSKHDNRATGWVDQTLSHAATSKSLLMN